MKNSEIASILLKLSDFLVVQNANIFRIGAYRRAAKTIEKLEQPVLQIVEQRRFNGLSESPRIATGIASSMDEYVAMGRMSRLDRLRDEHDPNALFRQIPGVDKKRVCRIVESLHTGALEVVEIVAHNGRPATVSGFGNNRVIIGQAWPAQV